MQTGTGAQGKAILPEERKATRHLVGLVAHSLCSYIPDAHLQRGTAEEGQCSGARLGFRKTRIRLQLVCYKPASLLEPQLKTLDG